MFESTIIEKLSEHKYDIDYVRNGFKSFNKSDTKISFEVETNDLLNKEPIVQQVDSEIIFFLSVNKFDYHYKMSIGQNNLNQQLKDFILDKLQKDANHSGNFSVSSDVESADLNVILKINSIENFSKLFESTDAILFFYNHNYSVGSSTSNLIAEIEIHKDKKLVFSDTLSSNPIYGYQPGNLLISDERLFDWAVKDQAESFSKSIRDINNKAIEQVNEFLKNTKK